MVPKAVNSFATSLSLYAKSLFEKIPWWLCLPVTTSSHVSAAGYPPGNKIRLDQAGLQIAVFILASSLPRGGEAPLNFRARLMIASRNGLKVGIQILLRDCDRLPLEADYYLLLRYFMVHSFGQHSLI